MLKKALKLLRPAPKFKTETLLGKEYLTRGFSIKRTDYDDAWLLALGLNAKNILDIGPNQGQSSLLLLYGEQVENIWLAEPNPEALSKAAEHLIHNKVSHKARFIPAFISDQNDKEVDFYTIGPGASIKSMPKPLKPLMLILKSEPKRLISSWKTQVFFLI